MALFKKKKAEQTGCGCGGCCDLNAEGVQNAQASLSEGAAVKVLGSACKKCSELEANTKAALAHLGMDTAIDHVTDFARIAAYGVMTTPALVVDGKVVAYGKVLKTDEVVKLLQKTRV
ncbi:thioredoxin family protein [Treponema sp. OttesenSCG-928-L16]|nr:thioredoxin family protein [Treponema sp. OttesenSCG-928-L16]